LKSLNRLHHKKELTSAFQSGDGRKAFLSVLYRSPAGLTDLYLCPPSVLLVEQLYIFSLANRTLTPAAGNLVPYSLTPVRFRHFFSPYTAAAFYSKEDHIPFESLVQTSERFNRRANNDTKKTLRRKIKTP
jgi:hypothetical protein